MFFFDTVIAILHGIKKHFEKKNVITCSLIKIASNAFIVLV